jgi:hypothetical protein
MEFNLKDDTIFAGAAIFYKDGMSINDSINKTVINSLLFYKNVNHNFNFSKRFF